MESALREVYVMTLLSVAARMAPNAALAQTTIQTAQKSAQKNPFF